MVRPDSRRERPDEFGVSGFGNPAVYQGSKPLIVPPLAPIEKARASGRVMKNWGLSRRDARFFLELPNHLTAVDAWRAAFPKDKSSVISQRQKASRSRRRIIAAIGGDDELMEAMGIGRIATYKTLADSLVAEEQREFIMPETGEVVEGKVRPALAIRFATAKLLTQIHKMVPDEKGGGGGTVVVNIVQYNPPGTPAWPGGGRV